MKDKISNKIRNILVFRDQCVCRYCGKTAWYARWNGFYWQAIEKQIIFSDDYYFPFEIDHIIPRCQGGKTTLHNLVLSCRFCNRSKSGEIWEVSH